MAKIVHIAVKCANAQRLADSEKFYQEIFGLNEEHRTHRRGHISQHMTDGNMDLTMMLYDSEEESEAQLAGAGNQIHHIGIEVDDRPSMIKKIEDNGGSIFSDKAEGALKYHSPEGILSEIVGIGRYVRREQSKLARITNVNIVVRDLDKAVSFYKNVFEFSELPSADKQAKERVVLTDGETNLTFIQSAGDQEPCIESWGFEVPNVVATCEEVTAKGGVIVNSDTDEKRAVISGPDQTMVELTSSVA